MYTASIILAENKDHGLLGTNSNDMIFYVGDNSQRFLVGVSNNYPVLSVAGTNTVNIQGDLCLSGQLSNVGIYQLSESVNWSSNSLMDITSSFITSSNTLASVSASTIYSSNVANLALPKIGGVITGDLLINGTLDVTNGIIGSSQIGAHNDPSSNVFMKWLNNTTSTIYNSWWAKSSTPIVSQGPNIYSNISPVVPSASTSSGSIAFTFHGGVNVPSTNTVILSPYLGCNVGIYSPQTNTFTNGPQTPFIPSSTGGGGSYSGGVLLPNGNICFVPLASNNSNISQYNPITNNFSLNTSIGDPSLNIMTAPGSFKEWYMDACLLPTGNVLMIPASACNFGLYNYNTNTFTQSHASNIPFTSRAFSCGVVLPEGDVCCIPSTASNICIYNTKSDSLTISCKASNYTNATLLPNGNILMVGWNNNTNLGIFNPSTSSMNYVSTSSAGSNAFSACSLMADGRVVLVPFNASNFGVYDYHTNEFNISAALNPVPVLGTSSTSGAFVGSIMLSSGNLLAIPAVSYNSGSNYNLTLLSGFGTPSVDMVYHPSFNKV